MTDSKPVSLREKTKRPSDTVVGVRYLEFKRGWRQFDQDEPCPECPPDDEFVGAMTLPACRWLGWMIGRAMAIERQEKVKNYIHGGGDL